MLERLRLTYVAEDCHLIFACVELIQSGGSSTSGLPLSTAGEDAGGSLNMDISWKRLFGKARFGFVMTGAFSIRSLLRIFCLICSMRILMADLGSSPLLDMWQPLQGYAAGRKERAITSRETTAVRLLAHSIFEIRYWEGRMQNRNAAFVKNRSQFGRPVRHGFEQYRGDIKVAVESTKTVTTAAFED